MYGMKTVTLSHEEMTIVHELLHDQLMNKLKEKPEGQSDNERKREIETLTMLKSKFAPM